MKLKKSKSFLGEEISQMVFEPKYIKPEIYGSEIGLNQVIKEAIFHGDGYKLKTENKMLNQK